MNLGKIVADGTGGRVDIEGSTRGPRGPKNTDAVDGQVDIILPGGLIIRGGADRIRRKAAVHWQTYYSHT